MTNDTLTVHHLGRSQSERIVWLCEELGLEYVLQRHERRKDNRLAPDEYKALHPMGTAPVITDGTLVLGESAAIVEYLITTRGDGRLTVRPGQPGLADYLYWFHFANGTLQPALLRLLSLERVDPSGKHPVLQAANERLDVILSTLDERLANARYLAGPELTAADIMTVFSLTTMRFFKPYDLSGWPHILAYLQRIGARPAYVRAMRKAEPDSPPLLGATAR
jgi:glutathione S-transferase